MSEVTTGKPLLTNRSYDLVKDAVQIGFPALIVLYSTLASIWQWDNSASIVASMGAVGLFLGVLVKIAAKRYETSGAKYDGYVTVIDNPEEERSDVKFSTTTDPYDLARQKEVVYKVSNPVQ